MMASSRGLPIKVDDQKYSERGWALENQKLILDQYRV